MAENKSNPHGGPFLSQPEYDVVVVGSGIAGAMLAYRLAQEHHRVVILEAGGVVPDSLGRWSMVHSYVTSPSKAADSPYCGNNILAPQQSPVPQTDPAKDYYDMSPGSDPFKSYYERLVGGSTWHWQGIYIRMLPSDFKMQKLYGRGFNWPISYDDLEPWYVEAEYEMGVAGNDKQIEEYFKPRFGAYRSKPYPMPELVPSYLDAQISNGVAGKTLDGIPLRVTNVPHAINTQPYDGRPACDGHTSCVPLCPIKARYEAITHVEKALGLGAVLRTQAVVTRLELDEGRQQVRRVWYRRWVWDDARKVHVLVPDEPELFVSGRVVVLAANGIENPLILLRSGVGNSSGAVGKYLMDHPIKQSYALSPRPLFPFRGPQTTSDIEGFRDGTFRRTFAGFKTSIKNDGWSTNPTGAPRGNLIPPQKGVSDRNPATLLDLVHNWGYFGSQLREKIRDYTTRQITLNSACEQLPDAKNRVGLSGKKDAMGLPRPLITYRVDDDQHYVRQSFKKAIQLHALIFEALGIPPADRTMQLDDDSKPLTYGGSGHIMGTTMMGSDPKTSVVDKDCRCHDLQNVFILGSSVFPTSSTANPTSTIAALALRAADAIKKRLR
jgi:choline dehydrogenase-like flavoprotein